jgi:DNA-binding MarR family transcriptional regulator
VSHPTTELDDVVHQRVRLGILAVLVEASRADFNFLRTTLSLTDGNLSRHLRVLEEAGCVEIHKVFEGRRPHTWVKATRSGREAFARELEALRALVDAHG